VKIAVDLLQEVAGPSSPVLFLKMGIQDWTPVGDESLYSVVPGRSSTAAVALCDREGNSKAISGWFPVDKVGAFAARLEERGIRLFAGELKLPI